MEIFSALSESNLALRSEKARLEQLVDDAHDQLKDLDEVRDQLKDLDEVRDKLREVEEKEVKNRQLIAALQQKDEQNQNELKQLKEEKQISEICNSSDQVEFKFYTAILNHFKCICLNVWIENYLI